MLKVFVPKYDAPTTDNARIANDVFPNSPRYLVVGEDATRDSLQALIADSSTTAILIMAHGDSSCIVGQMNEIALGVEDVRQNLGDIWRLPVFAYACRTSLELGQVFHKRAKSSGAWWGYSTTISAPNPREIKAFREVLDYIAKKFCFVKSDREAFKFFQELREICERHRARLVKQMAVSGRMRDAHEVAVGLNEAWAYLEAMLPAQIQPVRADIKLVDVIDGV